MSNKDSNWEDSYQKEKPKISIKRAKSAEIESSSLSPSDLDLPEPSIKTEEKKEIEIVEKATEKTKEDSAPVKEVKMTKGTDFPLDKIKQNLNPELKEVMKKVDSKVSKQEVASLINTMEKKKDVIFENTGVNVFDKLSLTDSSTLSKKLDEWNVPKEASDLNASVILAWLNKNKK